VAYTCSGCGEKFYTANCHLAHRIGDYGGPIHQGQKVVGYKKSTRHCLTREEMLAKGMHMDEKRGVWHSSAPLTEPLAHWRQKEEKE
jgi:hypothetical protein